MKRVVLAIVLAIVAISTLSVYSTGRRYNTWWFRRMSTVRVNGIENGFMHRRWNNDVVIITRTDTAPHQSYLVVLSGDRFLIHCGDWSAPSFPIFPINHVNAPCSFFRNGANDPKADNGIVKTLIIQPQSVEFTTVSGKRIKASW